MSFHSISQDTGSSVTFLELCNVPHGVEASHDILRSVRCGILYILSLKFDCAEVHSGIL